MIASATAPSRAERRRAEQEAASTTAAIMRDLAAMLSGPSVHPAGTPLSARLTPADVDRLARALPHLPADLKIELSKLLAHIPPAPPAISFREFVAKAKPDYRWFDYGERIHDRLMDVAEGRLRRLMIFAPPRHGKSELVSRLFSAYYQYRFPHRWVGLCSYGAELAYTLARSSRENYQRAGGVYGSARDADAVKHIQTGAHGGLWAAGVGGPITGKGFHLGLIDDPLKNSEEAKSVTIRTKHKEWWQGTFATRAEPNAAIVIIMTPWHEDDLANWLLRRETSGEDTHPERWHIIALDAIRDTSEKFFVPPTCTLEPDPRQHGEALAPERYPLSELLRKRQTVGSYYWSAMFQARPKPQEGNMFKRQWFTPLQALPSAMDALVRYWDIAGTDKRDAAEHDPDFTRSVLMGRYRERLASDSAETGQWRTRFVIVDATGGQMSPLKRDDHIVATTQRDAALYGTGVVHTWMENDPGTGGHERTAAIISKLAGHRARAEPPLGQSKELRAEPFQHQGEAGNVSYIVGDWNAEFFEELCGFPFAAHDDYVDAAAGAFAKVAAYADLHEVPLVIGVQRSAALPDRHFDQREAEEMVDGLGRGGGMFGPQVGLMG